MFEEKMEKSYISQVGSKRLLNNGIATYHTYVYDHQGNICNVVNQNGTLEQRYNYYPYGGLTNELSCEG